MKEVVSNYPQLFADTSSTRELDELMSLGIFTGITTNPLIIAKQAGNCDPIEYYQEIADKYHRVPVSIQLLDEPLDQLFEHAQEFSKIGKNIVIKVPMFPDGRALRLLPRLIDEGIKTNLTGLMTAEQVLMILQAGQSQGPNFVSLFFNRIRDGGGDPISEIQRSRILIDHLGHSSRIITGSIRKPTDVTEAIRAQTHIVTITPSVVRAMIEHPESVRFINESQQAWENYLSSQSS